MTEPLLHFAQVGAAIRRVGSGGGAQGVRAEAPQINAGGQRVFPQHAVINRAIGERPVNVPLPCRVFERPEKRTIGVAGVAGGLEVIVDPLQDTRSEKQIHRANAGKLLARTPSPRLSLLFPRVESSFRLGLFKVMFLRDKDWTQVVKTNHFPPSLFCSGGKKRVSAQPKSISEVVKDFEQSLENLRPSTKRVYVAGARAAIRAASLELWQSPSTTDLLASIGKSPTEKRV